MVLSRSSSASIRASPSARRCEPGDEGPAQVRVDSQAVEATGPVEQALEVGERGVAVRGRGVGHDDDERQTREDRDYARTLFTEPTVVPVPRFMKRR